MRSSAPRAASPRRSVSAAQRSPSRRISKRCPWRSTRSRLLPHDGVAHRDRHRVIRLAAASAARRAVDGDLPARAGGRRVPACAGLGVGRGRLSAALDGLAAPAHVEPRTTHRSRCGAEREPERMNGGARELGRRGRERLAERRALQGGAAARAAASRAIAIAGSSPSASGARPGARRGTRGTRWSAPAAPAGRRRRPGAPTGAGRRARARRRARRRRRSRGPSRASPARPRPA